MAPLPHEGKRGAEPRGRGAEVSSEDFLFHLYRGSELLQDNRVHEAKEELEAALGLQPADPKGQDLLAVVYFRLGMYPRAIEIFEQLVRAHPEERSPRVNLALCYLKTGQPQNARQLLESTVLVHPDNPRAWGYLGLAYERMGDYVKAREAFLRGGHESMARRMEELAGERFAPSEEPPPLTSPPEPFEELPGDVSEMEQEAPSRAAHSVRPPSLRPPMSYRPPPSVRPARMPSVPPPPVSLGAMRAPLGMLPPPGGSAPPGQLDSDASGPLPTLDVLSRATLIAFPSAPRVSAHASGLLRVTVTSHFAIRPGALRALSGSQAATLSSQPLPRRARGRQLDEPLGGAASPLVQLQGAGRLLIGPTQGRQLFAFTMNDEVVFLREDALLGFDDGILYENGRLAVGDGDAAAMVQLRGVGAVIAESQEQVYALEVSADEGVAVRREHVLGWVGRLLPRALAPSEAPAGQRGLVMFSGEGSIFIIDAKS